jgi:hypothetical protein
MQRVLEDSARELAFEHIRVRPKTKQAKTLEKWLLSWPPSIWSCGCAGLMARRPETRRWTLEVATARQFFERWRERFRYRTEVPRWCAKGRAMRLLKVRVGFAWDMLHGKVVGL